MQLILCLMVSQLIYCKAWIFRAHELFVFCPVKLFATWIFREWGNITYSEKNYHFIYGRNIGYSAITQTPLSVNHYSSCLFGFKVKR